ncbi:hypothetical protein AO286_21765 [Pseudomonas syringae]|nr:hypothetical protein AO286_21765 [Pseudomonas syringae]
MALAAGLIVVLIGGLFNRIALDVSVRPSIQIQPVEADTLFSDGEFAHMRSHGLVEFVPAHAEIAIGFASPDEPGQYWRYLGGRFVCHMANAP